jgi:hypothetical protein
MPPHDSPKNRCTANIPTSGPAIEHGRRFFENPFPALASAQRNETLVNKSPLVANKIDSSNQVAILDEL